jgi:putative mycofactocin binding protein MftB
MAAAGVKLHPACRVRAEKFGLLFYDLRGPRLLFAETGTLMTTDFFEANEPVDHFLERFEERDRNKVKSLLVKLREKGYLQ